MKTIIFVCASNTCRSPMAEAFAKKYITNKTANEAQPSGHGWHVTSAGITEDYEPAGSPASTHGVTVMRELYAMDISGHRSSMLTPARVQEAAAIYTLSESHRQWICMQFPGVEAKLKDLGSIPDPWHQPIEAYEQTARTIQLKVDAALERDWTWLLAS